MSGEVFSIIGRVAAVGIGPAVLILRTAARPDRRTGRMVDTRGRRVDGVEKGPAGLGERVAKLECLLEGLREAISGRRAA